jgi:hypothetical protein
MEPAPDAMRFYLKVGFEKLMEMMIATDMEMANKEKTLWDAGYTRGANQRMV